MSAQGQFNFDSAATDKGYAEWLVSRNVASVELARKLNLPVGHEVEVWLLGGVRLRGKLRLREEQLFIEEDRVRHLELAIERATFAYRDIESCVRLD